jgi:hypothetical protein
VSAEWVTAIATIAAVVVALALAVFHEHLRNLCWHPKLQLMLENRSPDCHLTVMKNEQSGAQAPCYYFRTRVKNDGNAIAQTVEVYIEQVLQKMADQTFKAMEDFLPLNLRWAHFGNLFFPGIPPGVYKHSDFGHVIEPSLRKQFSGEEHPRLLALGIGNSQTVMSLDLVVRPNTGSYLIPPGIYRFVVVAAAANATLIRRTIELNLTGKWFPDEARMFKDGVGLRIVE